MLAECRQTGSKFSQKISADWHQLRSYSASILSTKSVHIIRRQIDTRNQAKPVDRSNDRLTAEIEQALLL